MESAEITLISSGFCQLESAYDNIANAEAIQANEAKPTPSKIAK